MIRDTDTNRNPNEKDHGNAIGADLAHVTKARQYALELQAKGRNVDVLLAIYDEQIARLKGMK